MTIATITAGGRAIDLLDPLAETIDLEHDVADSLARLPRFNGQVGDGPWSVAAHSILVADAAFQATASRRLAALLILHDAHEAFVGDITTPVAWALAATADELDRAAGRNQAAASALVEAALHRLKTRLDAAIHAAAGLALPTPDETAAIKAWDRRALATEWRQWMPLAAMPAELKALAPLRLHGRLRVEPWPVVAAAFVERLRRYLGPIRQMTFPLNGA